MAKSFTVTRMDNGKSELIHAASVRDVMLIPRGGTSPTETSSINFRDSRQPLQVKETPAAIRALMERDEELREDRNEKELGTL